MCVWRGMDTGANRREIIIIVLNRQCHEFALNFVCYIRLSVWFYRITCYFMQFQGQNCRIKVSEEGY
jgi:hypothetical protein